MHIVQRVPIRSQKRMYLPSERQVVNGVGLGELEGMFNLSKMFRVMFKFTPSSFKMKNIAGAIGSISTGGIGNIIAEVAGPSGLKLTKTNLLSAHSKVAKGLGYGVMAVGAAAGLYFGGAALLPAAGSVTGGVGGAGAAATGGGFFSTAGSMLSTVGSGFMTVMKALPMVGQLFGGMGGGRQQQQGGMTQAEYDMQMAQAQQQAAYDAQARAQGQQMYQPGAMNSGIPISYNSEQPSMTGMNASYGDLRTPYTAIQEDGTQVQVDPRTGQVIQAGIIPDLAPTTWLMIGGATLAGWYLMSGNKSNN